MSVIRGQVERGTKLTFDPLAGGERIETVAAPSNGQFAIRLRGGTYRVKVGEVARWDIEVPSDQGDYELEQVIIRTHRERVDVVAELGLATRGYVEERLAKLTYVHRQDVPADLWEIRHDLGKFPSVEIVDSANQVVHGDIEHVNQNKVVVRFTHKFSGRAFLN
jgi:hypothetical protein